MDSQNEAPSGGLNAWVDSLDVLGPVNSRAKVSPELHFHVLGRSLNCVNRGHCGGKWAGRVRNASNGASRALIN